VDKSKNLNALTQSIQALFRKRIPNSTRKKLSFYRKSKKLIVRLMKILKGENNSWSDREVAPNK